MPAIIAIVLFSLVVIASISVKVVLPKLESQIKPTPSPTETVIPTPTPRKGAAFPTSPPVINTPTPLPTAIPTPAVTAKLREDKKAVIVEFGNLAEISKIYYRLTYTTQKVQRGTEGTINVKPQDRVFTLRRVIELGTSSQGVFTYDTGITSAILTVRFTKTDKKLIETTQNILINN